LLRRAYGWKQRERRNGDRDPGENSHWWTTPFCLVAPSLGRGFRRLDRRAGPEVTTDMRPFAFA
jgi:hypothetical protein